MDNLTAEQELKETPETTPAIPAPKRQYSPIIKKELTEAQEKKVVDLIKQEMTKTLETYDNYNNGEGWFDAVARRTQKYKNGKEVEEYDTDEKKRLLLSTMMCDIVASKEKRQTMGAKPLILLVPKPTQKDKYEANDLTERQDRLDYILRTDCAKEEVNYVSSRMACANGVSIEKYPYEKNIEYKTRKTLYNQQNIAEFEKNYAADIINPKSKAFKNWNKIKAGEEVEITDVEPIVQFNGVKPYRVDLKKFFARLDIKDFRRHKVISEMIDTYTWADIEARTAQDDSDPYGYDHDAVNRLKEKLGDKYLDSKNTVYESIVYVKLDSEVAEGEEKPKDKYQRYCVTYEDEFKIVLKCIYYPYEHNDIYYVAKTAIPNDDSWVGESFVDRTDAVTVMAEGFLNSLLHQFQLTEKGIVMTDDDQTDFSRVNLSNDDDISVVKFASGKQFSQFNWAFPNADRPGLINWVFNFGSLITGVDPAVNSGAQTPDDPRAPLGKALLKQGNSDRRIEDTILNLQKADELGARMVDWNYIQFVDEDKKEYFDGDYVCHGSTLSFSPEEDNQAIMAVWGATGTIAPQVAQNTLGVYTILSALYNNAGGSIKKNKDILLKPLKDQLDLEEATAKSILEFKTWARSQGRTEEEINAAIPQMLAKLRGQPAQGQPGQGMPPQGQPPVQPGPPSEVIQ